MRQKTVEEVAEMICNHKMAIYDKEGQWNGSIKIEDLLILILDHLDLEVNYEPMKQVLQKRKK